MSNQFIFEAGSTKTSVLMLKTSSKEARRIVLNDTVLHELTLSGYNPNRPESGFLDELNTLGIKSEDQIHFYGSGLNSDLNKEILKLHFRTKFKVEIKVYDDVLGAARASFKNESGMVGIMGTGGVVAFFDGEKIQDIKGGYGYLIDDIGGGYELGKVIVSAWLNQVLSKDVADALEFHLGPKRENFISSYYGNPDLASNAKGLAMIASTVKVFSAFKHKIEVQTIIAQYFELFLSRHVIPLSKKCNTKKITLIGSIAASFEEIIRYTLTANGLELNRVVRFPAIELWNFHFEESVKH